MGDMYEKIRREPEKKKDRSLTVMLVCCTVLIIVVVAVAVWFVGYQRRFYRFVGQLSESTGYAYENDCLKATFDGKAVRVNGDNNYKIYTFISVTGSGTEKYSLPKEGEQIVLDYGNGAVLTLWQMKKDNGREAVYLSFVNTEGKRYSYISDEMTLDTLKVRYLQSKKNRNWEE